MRIYIRDLHDRIGVAVTHCPAVPELADWKMELSEHGIRAEYLRLDAAKG